MSQHFSYLTDIYTAVSEAVQVATAGVQGAAGGVPSDFGEEFLEANVAPPYYFWVPQGPERALGPHFGPPLGGAVGDSQQMPRALFGRKPMVEVHCWGSPDPTVPPNPLIAYQNAEQLLTYLAQAIHEAVTPASYAFHGGRFISGRDFTKAGRIYVALFSFDMQVTDEDPTLATVTSFPGTDEFVHEVEH